jgi:hypothetical protein
MDQILLQAPPNMTYEEIEVIFKKNNENIINTLSALWDIKELPKKNKTKWDEIRETCDEHDMEMEKVMKSFKK